MEQIIVCKQYNVYTYYNIIVANYNGILKTNVK